MSFQRIFRQPHIKAKPARVPDDGIALQWWANPTAPFLGIHIGHKLASSIRLFDHSQPIQVLLGEGADFGMLGLRRVERGDWWCRVRAGSWCAFLDSHISNEYFELFERRLISREAITVSEDAVYFHVPRRKSDTGGRA
jgi:hypothetical protein